MTYTLPERIEILVNAIRKTSGKVFQIMLPPPKPGVYIGLLCQQVPVDLQVMYIGSSKNIESRLKHPEHPLQGNCNVLLCCECDDYQKTEHVLLRSVAMRLNKQKVNWKRNAK